MTSMSSVTSGSFDVVLEKATIDALTSNERSMWEMGEETKETVDRALKAGGTLIRG